MAESRFKQDRQKCYMILLGTTHPGFIRKIRLLLFHFGLHCIAVYRLGQLARRVRQNHRLLGLGLGLIHMFFDWQMRFIHHIRIDAEDIGPGFYIQHVGTIYIAAERIGSNLSLTHNVTIGIGYQKGGMGVPNIGDNVWIGTGAIIYGKISVGDGVAIASGSILTRDIPARSLVAGHPARVIQAEHDNSHYFGSELNMTSGSAEKPADG